MSDKKEDANNWADYWRYFIGVNVIPANTREKTVSISWKEYQNNPTSEEQHNKWKQEHAFDNGMAIIAGKVWHNTVKKDLYLILVDLDNQKAIDEFCTRNGVKTPLSELAKGLIIEQHQDEPNKAHAIFYSTHPFPKKSSDIARLSDVLEHNEVPAIEIKGAGEHGLLFCTPSPHRNGYNYEIIGTNEPQTIDQMQRHLENICKKYGMLYPTNSNNASTDSDSLIPVKDLLKPGTKILEGQNRHEALLRVMESLLIRNQTVLDEQTIMDFAEDWNKCFCEPPLDKREFARQWKDAIKFVDGINKRRAFEQYQHEERVKRELVEQELAGSEERKNEKKNPLRIAVLARLNEEAKTHYAAGQLSSLGVLYKRVRSAYARCNKCGQDKETVFLHPEKIQYFNEYFGGASLCEFYFKNMHCDGVVKIEPRYINALDIEVHDTNSLQEIDRLKCILFEDDTKDVGIGENVTICGSTYMETFGKSGSTYPVSYLQSVKYEEREQEELTGVDIDAIKRFREHFPNNNEFLSKLVSMTACDVIGYQDIKLGILYMVSRAKPDDPKERERIHGLIISLPGMAKTALLMYATELMSRSTFETAQLSTGLSLIAMVENTGEMKILRLGPVSASLFASVDEFNRLSGSDQDKFFGVMEEGRTTSAKFGRKVKITAPVTILASINPPEGSTLNAEGKMDLTDMNIVRPIMDRFDLTFYIPPMKDEDEIRRLVEAKSNFEGRKAPDYSKFIKRYMVYVKQHFNPKVTPEAISVLNEAYIEIRKNDQTVTDRKRRLLFNLVKARARVLQKHIADSEDAKSIVEYYSRVINEFKTGTIQPKDPIETAIKECMMYLSEPVVGENTIEYTIDDLLKKACESNLQVDKYIKSGASKKDYFDISNNKRARYVYERLVIRYPEIEKISKRPITLKLVPKTSVHSDHSDHSDLSGRDRGAESVTNLSVSDANPKPQILLSERENTSSQTGVAVKAGSERSERSESTTKSKNKGQQRKAKKRRSISVGELRESRHKYPCPVSGCGYRNADPSKITEHVEAFHNDKEVAT